MKIIFTFLILLVFQILPAQKSSLLSCEKEMELNKIIIDKLQKENTYYKESLNLLTPIKSIEIDGLKFDIIKITSSKKDLTLNIEFIYKNITDMDRVFFQCEQAFLIDSKGNQFQTYELFVGAEKNIRVENITPNIPRKGRMQFKISESNMPIIKELKLKFYSKSPLQFGDTRTAIFENIDI